MPFVNVQLIVSDYQVLGIDLPPAAVEVLDIWAALSEAAAAKPGNDLRALLTDGTLTAANAPDRLREAALTLALRGGMESLLRDLDRPATARAMSALADDAPRVVSELHPHFTAAAATVVEGLGHFSPEEFARPEVLLTQRPGAAAHFHPTTQAGAELDLIARLLNAIRPLAIPVSGYIGLTDEATAETLSGAQSAYNSGQPLRWVSLFATAGVTAALNTGDEAAQVAARSAELGRTRDAETKNRAVRRARKAEPWLVS